MKATVEDCQSLDTNDFARRGCLKEGLSRSGDLRWTRADHETGSCGFYADVMDTYASITFYYNYDGSRHPDVKVNLSWYSPGFGGRRYLFVCPYCGRRMRTLHIREGEIACRVCHHLTYQSCNESHCSDSLYKSMAIDLNISSKEIKECLGYIKREAKKAPKRPRGRPRKSTWPNLERSY